MTIAPLDQLRALPPPIAREVLRQMAAAQGPAAVAALRWDLAATLNPMQRIPATLDEWPAILVLTGVFRAGKSFLARALFLEALRRYRVEQPRIMAASKAAVASDVVGRRSTKRAPGGGFLDMIPPWIRTTWEPSLGYAGRLTIDGAPIECIGAEGGAGAVGGPGCGLCLADDFAKWVRLNGLASAESALQALLTNMSGSPGRLILPTTPDGAGLVMQIAGATGRDVAIWDLGTAADNAFNLAEAYASTFVPALADAGLLELGVAQGSPWKDVDFAAIRERDVPPLVEFCVPLDPNKGAGCEFGCGAVGRDARGSVHVAEDATDAATKDWPVAAWDVADRYRAQHPGARWFFLVESNTGGKHSDKERVLRGEEERRTREKTGKALPSTCEIRYVRSTQNKCARAEGGARLARQRPPRVFFADRLGKVETQLRQLTPTSTRSDRADMAVHGINAMAGLDAQPAPDVGARARAAAAMPANVGIGMPKPAFLGKMV